jgi:putative transposase
LDGWYNVFEAWYQVCLLSGINSRYIVGWSLSYELDTENCLDALKLALKTGKPAIINSDQGCQFTSKEWVATLTEIYVRISMDGKRRCSDNIYIERFWRTIKYEAYYLNEYYTFTELYLGIQEYIEFYNNERPHQSLGYETPKMIYDSVEHTKENLFTMNFGSNHLENMVSGLTIDSL